MIVLKFCPNCESNNIIMHQQVGTFPRMYYDIMPGIKVKAGVITEYSMCLDCNLIFQNPRLSDRILKKFYSQGYYRKSIGEPTKKMDDDEREWAIAYADIIKKCTGEISSHLDIGCSRGYLLEKVRAKVKVGVEPDPEYVKAKNIKVYSRLNQVSDTPFQLITAVQVLEHVSKPLELLRAMTKLVENNGYLVVVVPTWDSSGGPFRLAHLYHFEPDVLRLMCKQVGLKVVQSGFVPHLMLICTKN